MEKLERLSKAINNKKGLVLIDWPLLQDACLHKKELIIKLLGLFVQQVPGWIKEMRESVREADEGRVRTICHTVTGATSAIHAPACVENLRKLHTTAKEERVDFVRLQEDLEGAVAAIEKTKDAVAELLIACSDA
jgi:HPt (histidine-containing phosphotransfer) domain-containing protein